MKRKARTVSKKGYGQRAMAKCNLLLEVSPRNSYEVYRNTVRLIAIEIIKDLRRV